MCDAFLKIQKCVGFLQIFTYSSTLILVSHSPSVANMCDECYELIKISKAKRTRN